MSTGAQSLHFEGEEQLPHPISQPLTYWVNAVIVAAVVLGCTACLGSNQDEFSSTKDCKINRELI